MVKTGVCVCAVLACVRVRVCVCVCVSTEAGLGGGGLCGPRGTGGRSEAAGTERGARQHGGQLPYCWRPPTAPSGPGTGLQEDQGLCAR